MVKERKKIYLFLLFIFVILCLFYYYNVETSMIKNRERLV